MTHIISTITGGAPTNISVGNKAQMYIQDVSEKTVDYSSKFKGKLIGELLLLTNDELKEAKEDDVPFDYVMEELLEMFLENNAETIFSILTKRLKLDEPMILVKKKLFWKWKEMVECAIVMHLENTSKNTKPIVKSWIDFCKKNKIDTSSVILTAITNKQPPLVPITIDYKGWCPYDSDNRLKDILSIDIDNLDCELDGEWNFILDELESFSLPHYPQVSIELKIIDEDDNIIKLREVVQMMASDLIKYESVVIHSAELLSKIVGKIESTIDGIIQKINYKF